MKKISVILSLLLLFSLTLALVGCSKAAATVNDEKISNQEIELYFDFFKSQDTEGVLENDQEAVDNVQSNILDSLIVVKLLRQYAQKEGIEAEQDEVSSRYQEIVSTYNSTQEFDQALETMGIDEDFLKKELENQILRSKIFDMATSEVEVTEEEARNYYQENKEDLFLVPEKVKVSHVLAVFKAEQGQAEISDEAKQAAREKIDQARQALEEGQPFDQVAQQYSDDTTSAENGGNLGFVSRGEMPEEFEREAFALEVGQVSDIVETMYGYHLLKVTQKQEEYIKEFDEVRETVIAYVENEEKNAVWSDFIYGLIDEAEIKYNTDIKSYLTSDEAIEEGQN